MRHSSKKDFSLVVGLNLCTSEKGTGDKEVFEKLFTGGVEKIEGSEVYVMF